VMTRECRTVAEDLVASKSGAHCESKRKPLQLEGGSANDEDGRRDVYAGDVLRCQWARGLSGMGGHLCRALLRVLFGGVVLFSSERRCTQQDCSNGQVK
jgi:hypothetical protein